MRPRFLLFALAAVLVLVGSPARAIDLGPPAPVAAKAGTGVQSKPALAFGGGVYLAVWQDGDETADVDGPGTEILCARISTEGKPLDPQGISVCKAPDYQMRPRVAYAGNVFLVVWEDFRNGSDGDIYAARVTPEGKVLDPDGFPVAAIKGRNQVYAAVASSGKDFLVAWMDYWTYPTYGIAVARIAPDGKVAPKDGVLVLKEDDAKLKAAAGRVRSSQDLLIPWAKGWVSGGLVGTLSFPELIFVNDHYLLLCNSFGAGRRLSRIPATGPLVAQAGSESAMKLMITKGFTNAFVAGPAQGWIHFRQENFGRGQDAKRFISLVVKPDGSLPKPDGNGNTAPEIQAQSGDQRGIVDLNAAGTFDGQRYLLAIEARTGIALGSMAPDGTISGLDLAGDRAKGQFMLATGEGCRYPALASDGKGAAMAVWSDDAGIDDVRLKCRAIKAGHGERGP